MDLMQRAEMKEKFLHFYEIIFDSKITSHNKYIGIKSFFIINRHFMSLFFWTYFWTLNIIEAQLLGWEKNDVDVYGSLVANVPGIINKSLLRNLMETSMKSNRIKQYEEIPGHSERLAEAEAKSG